MTFRIAAAVLLLSAALPAAARPVTPSPEVAALREEIAALQVDRALALTPEQARVLLPVLQQAAAQVQAMRARAEAAQPALVAALTKARDELRAGGAITPETEQAIRQARGAAWQGGRGEGQAIRKQVLAILTPAQLKALESVRLGAGPGRGPGLPGAGPQGEPGQAAGKGRGFLRRLVLVGVLTSDPFLSLVSARAR